MVAVHRWWDGATKRVLVIGNVHGDERAGLRVVRRLRHSAVPRGTDLWLVRSMNPDGLASGRRTNAHRVDLNHNFPRWWVRAGRGTTAWSGPSAASEPETRHVIALVRRIRPALTVVIRQPLHGVDSSRAKSPATVRALARESRLPLRSFACHGRCHGALIKWHDRAVQGSGAGVWMGQRAPLGRVFRVARAVLRVGMR